MNNDKRREIAMWRMSILGALVSARLEHGDRRALLEAAAARSYEAPDGRRVRFTWRTLEGRDLQASLPGPSLTRNAVKLRAQLDPAHPAWPDRAGRRRRAELRAVR